MQIKNIISFEKVSFYRDSVMILDDVTLTIPLGKITAIMGPSGCGKTTLLRTIGGQIKPAKGKIIVDGQDVASLKRSDLYKLRRKMGMLFQGSALFSDLSVFNNVAFPLREHTNLSENMIADLVYMKLHAVGLRGAAHLMPSELSGGMARRVALARAIALDPEIIMYDEPFTGQDPISMGVLVKLIRFLSYALHMTTVLVSHDVPETISIADYVYLVTRGKIRAHGSPQDLLNSDDPWVKQFMQGLPDGPVPFHYPARSYGEDLAWT